MASLDDLLHEVRRIEEHREKLTEKRIKSVYRQLIKDLNSFLADEYLKYADKDGRLLLSYLDSKNKRAKFLEEIVKNVDGISPEIKREMLDLVDKTYEKAYKGMADAVKNSNDTKELLSYTNTLVKPEVLNRAVANNIDKLTLNAVMEKHRAEVIADIQQTLTLGLMRGDRYETMAKRIEQRLGVSYSKASNIARTESHRNIESGLMDGAEETARIIDQDGNLIYAATWRTMRDERVRPQTIRKTKKGWKQGYSNNGANHMRMDGVTVKAGELFDLGNGVKAKSPGQSGSAANDCNCRCYISYKLMTIEEFAKATNQSVEAVKKKYLTNTENYGRTEAYSEHSNKTLIENLKGQYTVEDVERAIEATYANGTVAGKQAINKYCNGDIIETWNATENKQVGGRVYFNAADMLNDERGFGVRYAHEMGHLIDYKAGSTKSRLSAQNSNFMNALRSDADKYIADFKKKNGNFATSLSISLEIGLDPAMSKQKVALFNGISDIFESLTNGAISGRYGHSSKRGYWAKKGAVEGEAFAHMFEAQFDKQRYKLMEKYFPNALKEFEELLKGAI